MTYTFKIYGKPKAIKADSMDEALEKVSHSHFFSYANNQVYFIMSDDPEAPKNKCIVECGGMYNCDKLVEVEELPEYEERETSVSTILLVIGIVALLICALN